MNTLRQAGNFVGIPSGARQVARFDGSRDITLSMVCALINVQHPENRPRSLGAVIRALQNLPPLTLNAELLSGTTGEEPYDLAIRLNPSGAIIWHTTVVLSSGGAQSSHELGSAGGDVRPTQLGPGTWDITVERAGIGTTGMAVLTKSVGQVVVRAKQVPQPPPATPPLPPPTATCAVEIGQAGFGGSQAIRVFGGGFLPAESVNIIEFEQVAATSQADQLGRYSVELGIATASPPVQRTYRAHGQTSSRTSNNAGITL